MSLTIGKFSEIGYQNLNVCGIELSNKREVLCKIRV